MWDEFSKSAFPVSKPSSHFLFILLCWFAHSSSHCWLCSWLLSPGNTQLPISPPEPPQVWMDHRCHLWLWGAGSGAPGTSSPVVLPSVSRTGTPIYELPTGILCIFRNLWKSGSVMSIPSTASRSASTLWKSPSFPSSFPAASLADEAHQAP